MSEVQAEFEGMLHEEIFIIGDDLTFSLQEGIIIQTLFGGFMGCKRHPYGGSSTNPVDPEFCLECEYEREQFEIEQMRADPYECMPFGDAQRWEDEQVFQDMQAEREDDYRDYESLPQEQEDPGE